MPQKPTEEQLYHQMQRGVATAQVMDIIRPVVEQRQADLVHNAIRAYRSIEHKYTPDEALLCIASLAANQDIVDELERIIRDGQRAGQHFVK